MPADTKPLCLPVPQCAWQLQMPVSAGYCAARGWTLLCGAGERTDLHQWNQSSGKTSSPTGVIPRQANPVPFSWGIPHYETELPCRIQQQRRQMCWSVRHHSVLHSTAQAFIFNDIAESHTSHVIFVQMWMSVCSGSRASTSVGTQLEVSSVCVLQVTSWCRTAGAAEVRVSLITFLSSLLPLLQLSSFSFSLFRHR